MTCCARPSCRCSVSTIRRRAPPPPPALLPPACCQLPPYNPPQPHAGVGFC